MKAGYFTGVEPFLHAETVALLGYARAHAPTRALSDPNLIAEDIGDRLGAAAGAGR